MSFKRSVITGFMCSVALVNLHCGQAGRNEGTQSSVDSEMLLSP